MIWLIYLETDDTGYISQCHLLQNQYHSQLPGTHIHCLTVPLIITLWAKCRAQGQKGGRPSDGALKLLLILLLLVPAPLLAADY